MISFTLNDETVTTDDTPDTPLLWVIRDTFKLKGSKYGCGAGLCGACTMHVDGVAVRTCVLPVEAVSGKAIKTIEGLGAPDSLRPLQAARGEQNGPQCSGSCPEGKFCGKGTAEPEVCRNGTYCPEGAPAEIDGPEGTVGGASGRTSGSICPATASRSATPSSASASTSARSSSSSRPSAACSRARARAATASTGGSCTTTGHNGHSDRQKISGVLVVGNGFVISIRFVPA